MQRKFAVKSEIKMKRKEGEKFSRTMRKRKCREISGRKMSKVKVGNPNAMSMNQTNYLIF